MKTIHILGAGCKKCNDLYNTTEQIANDLELDCQLEKITDMMKFADYGVMITPALVVDGKLKMAGKIPTNEELKRFLTED